MQKRDVVTTALDSDEASVMPDKPLEESPIGAIKASHDPRSGNLLGFVLDMAYDEATVVTCDAWKQNCGGVPKNSFVLMQVNASANNLSPSWKPKPSLILGRVREAVGTPVSSDVQQTVFSIHKLQAVVDPYTNAELQWSALKVAILGTYYDDGGTIQFGNDIDSYISPHFYEVYVPAKDDLNTLINSFVDHEHPYEIGKLRYTETQTNASQGEVNIQVSPLDFIANRTALFGKTRMGKSNTIKVIADMMIRSGEDVGQVIFDLNGEYANINEWDETALYALHQDQCVRFSLDPGNRMDDGSPPPQLLKVNFFEQVALGHSIISSLFHDEHRQVPNYVRPLLEWDPMDDPTLEEKMEDEGEKTRHRRARAMYFAALHKAGFHPDAARSKIQLHLKRPIREALANQSSLSEFAETEEISGKLAIADYQNLPVAVAVFEKLYALYQTQSSKSDSNLFGVSKRSGLPYFEEIHKCLLQMLGGSGLSGTRYLIPFSKYHDTGGGDIAEDIVKSVDQGLTVVVDLANADEVVSRFYSEMITRAIFRSQTKKFTTSSMGNHSVLFYFEEAHNLFRKDDRDLTSIYNRLAKEGAKNRIGMVYATQSITTLSPDLLKNTENFFVAHLNDDREIRELTYRYEFSDVGLDVQRCKTKGYVRMITHSHRYALPVQIRKFEAT